ncbi:MAG: FimV/HubP family polar landmark protein [Pseudomonadota bacterium]
MRSRKLKWSLGACALLLSQAVLAIGLGEIRLQSAMEERLQAEIDLLNIGDLDEQQMIVSLAPPEDFEQAGVDRDFQLADLRFRVDLEDKARPVIRVSSRQVISEPYLNFLVELRWPSGRLLREYTLLLDLPTFAGESSAGKRAAATRTVAADSRGPAPAPVQRPAGPPAAAPAGGAGTGIDRVQVRGGDTLWGIAQRHRPAGATIHQTMVAIAAANPEALIGGDLNRIRRGAWLTLPAAERVRAVDRQTALASLQQRPATPPVVEAGAAEVAPADSAGAGGADGELRLTAADGSGAGGGAGSAAGTGQGGAQAGQDLAAVLEERDRLARENTELQARIDSLQAQLSTLNRLVELDAPTLANLPDRPGGGAAIAPAPAGDAAGPTADQTAAVESTLPAEPAAVATPPEPVAEPAPEPRPETPETTAATTESPTARGPLAALSQLSDRLLPWLGAAAALLIGLLIWFALRGRSGIQQQGLQLPGDLDRPATTGGAAPERDEIPERELFATPSTAEGPEDALAEADVCLSFGNDAQAEELLREALEEYPNEPRLHLKLLEVFASRSDRAAFAAHLPQLAALGDLDTFAAAEALQRQLEDSADRTGEGEPLATGRGATAPDTPLADFELDLELDLDAVPAQAAAPQRTAADTSLAAAGLEDFDLGLDQFEESAADTEVSGGAEAGSSAAAGNAEQSPLEDLELFAPGQEVATQLELAHAYVDMGDAEGAREILDYVVEAGDDEQREAARELLARLG